MVDGAGRGHDEVRRPVPAVEEGAHRPRGAWRRPCSCVPTTSQPSGWSGKSDRQSSSSTVSSGLSSVAASSSRITSRSVADVLGAQQRLRHDVGQQLDAERRGPCRHAQVEDRLLLGGVGVEVATGGVDGHRDLLGVPRRGALEQQVLEEVRDTGLLDRLVPAAHADPDPDGDRAGPGAPPRSPPGCRWAASPAGPRGRASARAGTRAGRGARPSRGSAGGSGTEPTGRADVDVRSGSISGGAGAVVGRRCRPHGAHHGRGRDRRRPPTPAPAGPSSPNSWRSSSSKESSKET